jgi:two-component system response regulator
MNGFELLEWCRGQPHLMTLPLVVFSSSTNPEDMEKSKRLGAREYLVKPTGFQELKACVRELADRYLVAVGSGGGCRPIQWLN